MKATNKKVTTFAGILVQVGPFNFADEFEVTERDAKKIFEEHEGVVLVAFFDVITVEIDGVKYQSEMVNKSDGYRRDGSIVSHDNEQHHEVKQPSPESFYAPGTNAIN